MTDAKIALTLSTARRPARKLLIDGQEYDLLNLEHLAADAENELMALFARHNQIVLELENAARVADGQAAAARLKKCQNRCIQLLTTIPKDVVEKLPMVAKNKLFQVVQASYDDAEGDDDITAGGSEERADGGAAAEL